THMITFIQYDHIRHLYLFIFFLFFLLNDTAPTEIYTLSLHDALPISVPVKSVDQQVLTSLHRLRSGWMTERTARLNALRGPPARDRKSTRLNSSHVAISYAVFCLKKKKTTLCTVLMLKPLLSISLICC